MYKFPSAVIALDMFPTLSDSGSACGAHLGPSFMNVRGTEVVIWSDENAAKSGRPLCLLCDWLDVDMEVGRETNVSELKGNSGLHARA